MVMVVGGAGSAALAKADGRARQTNKDAEKSTFAAEITCLKPGADRLFWRVFTSPHKVSLKKHREPALQPSLSTESTEEARNSDALFLDEDTPRICGADYGPEKTAASALRSGWCRAVCPVAAPGDDDEIGIILQFHFDGVKSGQGRLRLETEHVPVWEMVGDGRQST